MCASFRAAVVRELLLNAGRTCEITGPLVSVSGGVAANRLLRKNARELCSRLNIPLYIPPIELCTDNGAMIAAAGYYRVGLVKDFPFELNAIAGLELTGYGEE